MTSFLVFLACASAAVAVVPFARSTAALAAPTALASTYPGSAAAGKRIFVTHCGKCHALRAAGSVGTLGPDLDNLPGVTFAVVVNAIVEGAGGIQAEYTIHSACTTDASSKCLTWSDINNVAKFVTTERGKPAYRQTVPQPVPT